MLRGNPPPPTSFFFSLSFPSLFKKKSENFGGGGFEPPEPPLKYALDLYIMLSIHYQIRKLEFLLAEAIDQGCRHVITCGGI